MNLSLILPCYNPPQGWERNIYTTYAAFCKRINTSAELLIVLDGESLTVTQESLTYLEKNIPGIKIIRYPENHGKGYAIRQGAANATGEIVLYTDIDFPYTIDSMCSVYEGLDGNKYDVGVGVKDAAYYRRVPLVRLLISRCLRFLTGLFLSMPITDTQCGLKGFRREVMPVFSKTTIDRYLFDLEFLRNCFKNKEIRVKAIPVSLNENVHFRKMNYHILLPEILNFAALLFKRPDE